MSIASVNPATGETLRSFVPHGAADIDRIPMNIFSDDLGEAIVKYPLNRYIFR